jgi:hypothetical protein
VEDHGSLVNSDAMTDLERAQNLHSPKKILHFDPPGCVLKELWDQSRCIQSNVKPRAHSDISDIFRYTVYYIYIIYNITKQYFSHFTYDNLAKSFGMCGFG